MYTALHELITAKIGEPVQITFVVTDAAGAPVDVSGGTGLYRIGRRRGEKAIVSKTSPTAITLSGNTATVDFLTTELVDASAAQLSGKFWGEMKITLGGDSLYVAQGPLLIEGIVEPP